MSEITLDHVPGVRSVHSPRKKISGKFDRPLGVYQNEHKELKIIYGDETNQEMEEFSKGGKLFLLCSYNQVSDDGEPIMIRNDLNADFFRKLYNDGLKRHSNCIKTNC